MADYITGKLENIISGHKINDDDAAWLRSLAPQAPAEGDELPLPAPRLYCHELLENKQLNPTLADMDGIWIGCNDLNVVKHSHTPGETGDEILALYTAEQVHDIVRAAKANVQPKGTERVSPQQWQALIDAARTQGIAEGRQQARAERLAATQSPAPAHEPVAEVGCDDHGAAVKVGTSAHFYRPVPTGTKLYTGPSSAVAHSKAAQDVLAERQRQISVEGWTPEHDDEHGSGCMAFAAAAYAAHAYAGPRLSTTLWNWTGWSRDWWKPKNPRADLIRAGALILAEVERLDRASKPPVQHKEGE